MAPPVARITTVNGATAGHTVQQHLANPRLGGVVGELPEAVERRTICDRYEAG
jgi:hypothetical protein